MWKETMYSEMRARGKKNSSFETINYKEGLNKKSNGRKINSGGLGENFIL